MTRDSMESDTENTNLNITFLKTIKIFFNSNALFGTQCMSQCNQLSGHIPQVSGYLINQQMLTLCYMWLKRATLHSTPHRSHSTLNTVTASNDIHRHMHFPNIFFSFLYNSQKDSKIIFICVQCLILFLQSTISSLNSVSVFCLTWLLLYSDRETVTQTDRQTVLFGLYLPLYLFLCLSVCLYLSDTQLPYVERQRDRKTKRLNDKRGQMDRQMNRQTHTQKYRWINQTDS